MKKQSPIHTLFIYLTSAVACLFAPVFIIHVFIVYASFFHLFFTNTNPCQPASTFTIRSQGLNGAMRASDDIARENNFFYFPEKEKWSIYDDLVLGRFPDHLLYPHNIKSLLSCAISYQKSFNSDAISSSLFGNYVQKSDNISHNTKSRKNIIKIQGSKVPDRDSCAWLADYFYLSETFDGEFTFAPSISNTIVDINAYIDLNMIANGLFAKIGVPLVHTQWDLQVQEKINNDSGGIIAGGRFSPDSIESDNLFTHALNFFTGHTPPVFSQEGVIGADTEALYTIHRQPLMAHHIESSCGKKRRTGLAEIRFQVGYDIVRNKDYHFSLSFAGALPASHKKKDYLIFSPQIGNNSHAEIGMGVSAHLGLWDDERRDITAGFYIDTLATHIVKAKERRTFDIKNKPLSRYMLAAKHVPLVPAGGPNRISGSAESFDLDFDCLKENDITFSFVQDNELIFANYQFANEFSPVANLTTQDVMVSVAAQLDATAWFNISTKHIHIDLGYNFWIKAKDTINGCGKNSKLHAEQNSWALHGDGQLFGYFDNSITVAGTQFSDSSVASKAIAIAASQSAATLNSGAPVVMQSSIDDLKGHTNANANADNALFAFAQTVPAAHGDSSIPLVSFENKNETFQAMEVVTLLPEKSIQLSLDPIFLKETDIDLAQGQKALSHSFFGSISYNIKDHKRCASYVSLGGKIEFGSKQGLVSSLSQWSMWAKFGLIFN